MQKVCDDIISHKIKGNIVEFGTWQGLGLIFLSRCLKNYSSRLKLIGIDSFEGLPETSTVWKKGDFCNTTKQLAERNIFNEIKNKEHLSFHLIKGWFDDELVQKELIQNCDSISLVHFDADLGSSTLTALKMVEPYLIDREQPIYFLFDDWGCDPNEVPDAFHGWYESAKAKYQMKAEKVLTTKLTRYYKVTFNKEV